MLPILAFAINTILTFTAVRNGCQATQHWANVNIPIAPNRASTEVVLGGAVFDSGHFVGSLLTLRNGQRYVADLSPDSATLLRALGIKMSHPPQRGETWPVDAGRSLPARDVQVQCFIVR